MDLKSLQYFEVCIERGSFSAAAEELYTTQSNVSKVIHSLETELGVQLFVRGRRGLTLTDDGQHLRQFSGSLVRMGESVLKQFNAKKTNTLRLAYNYGRNMDIYIANYYVNSDYDAIQVYALGTADAVQYVEENRVDAAFVMLADLQYPVFEKMLDKRGMKCEVILRDATYLSVGKKHPLYNEPYCTVEQLAQAKLAKRDDSYFSYENSLCTAIPQAAKAFETADVFDSHFLSLEMQINHAYGMLCMQLMAYDGSHQGLISIELVPRVDSDLVCVTRKDYNTEQMELIERLKKDLNDFQSKETSMIRRFHSF